MFVSVLANRFRIFTDFPKPSCSSVYLLWFSQISLNPLAAVFNCFGFLKPHGSYRWLFQCLLRSVHRFPGGFRKAIGSSHAALDQLLTLQQEGFRKSEEILKHFARGKIKLVN
jgi:hypothetical protein